MIVRDPLFRELLALGFQPRPNQPDSTTQFEFSPADIAAFGQYADLLKKKSKVSRDPGYLTGLLFDERHPDRKGKKLKDVDPEGLKNEWANIYYQVVLPFLGRTDKKREQFNYTPDLIQRITSYVSRLRSEQDVLSGIGAQYIASFSKTLTPDYTSFDNRKNVQSLRQSVMTIWLGELIPLLIEGLNLTSRAQVYKALTSLNDGATFDLVVDILAYHPTQVNGREQRYETKKRQLIRVLNDRITEYLAKRKPSDIQQGPEEGRAGGANKRAAPAPDKPPYSITGRFEYVHNGQPPSPNLGLVLCINQAGNWLEGFLSFVYDRQKVNAPRLKSYYRFYAEITNWSQPISLIYKSGNDKLVGNAFQLSVTGSDNIQLVTKSGPVSLRRVGATPMVTERHLAEFPTDDILKYHQWFPLLSVQEANIRSFCRDFGGYRQLVNNPDYGKPMHAARRKTHLKNLLAARIKGDEKASEELYRLMYQFIDENFHASDRVLASYYIRYYLNQKSITSVDDWTLSLSSWLYRFLKLRDTSDTVSDFVYGDTSGDKITPGNKQLYEYKIAVDLSGVGAGYYVKAGYYRGEMTVSCSRWTALGAGGDAKFGISLFELGGGAVVSVNFGQSFGGVAQSDVLWMPGDFIGRHVIGKADAEVGVNIAKIRKKLGLSAGISGTVGVMEIESNSKLPPMHFGIYSLGGVLAGVEPTPQKEYENKFGVEVTVSAAGGSIWKKGALPAPKGVIQYGNEATKYGKVYWGDEKAHFKHDSALLTTGALNLIRRMCANELALLVRPGTTVQITGHTDRTNHTNDPQYNSKLSENRALNVKQKLIDICGTTLRAPIGTVGKGETLAISEGVKPQGISPEHRRVEVKINGVIVLTLVE